MRQSRLLGLLEKERQWYYDFGWFKYNTKTNGSFNDNDLLKPMRFHYDTNGIYLSVTNSQEYDPHFYTICLGNDGNKTNADGLGCIIEIDLNKINQDTGKIIKKGNAIKFNIENKSAGGRDKTYNNSFFWAIIDAPVDMNQYATSGNWGGRQYISNSHILKKGTFSVNLTTTENYTVEARFFFEDDIQHQNPILGYEQLLKFFHLGQPNTVNTNIITDKKKYFHGTGKIYLLIWGEPQGDRENFHIKPVYMGNGTLETPATSSYFVDGHGVRVAIGYLAPSEYKNKN